LHDASEDDRLAADRHGQHAGFFCGARDDSSGLAVAFERYDPFEWREPVVLGRCGDEGRPIGIEVVADVRVRP
jgi:hypothetical protein